MIISITLSVLWFVFIYFLFLNKRFVAINVFVSTVLVAFLQPFFLCYNMQLNEFFVETNYQIIINRFLILCVFSLTLCNKIKISKRLIKLSKTSKNLLLKENRLDSK